MAFNWAVLHRNQKCSDVTVQIRQVSATDGSDELEPRSKRPRAAVHPQQASASDTLVEEFPGHKAAFFAASEYFRALMDWEQCDTICIRVQQHQVVSARALIHFFYHGSFSEDTGPGDMAQLLLLADEYGVTACVVACVEALKAAMAGGRHLPAVLEVCRLLGQLGAVSPSTRDLFLFFQEHATELRTTFSKVVEAPQSNGGGGCSTPYSGAFGEVVGILRAMYRELDQLWQQEEYRQILNLFPMEAVRGLLEWDDLSPVSENVVVTAIHHWLYAQPPSIGPISPTPPTAPADPTAPPNPQSSRAQSLLSLVRVPYLSPSYLSHVFPNLTWWKGNCAASSVIMFGTCVALAGEGRRDCLAQGLPAELKYMVRPRRYKCPGNKAQLAWEVPWALVAKAKALHDSTGKAQRVAGGPLVWVNGVRVGLHLQVGVVPSLGPASVSPSPSGPISIRAYWGWDIACGFDKQLVLCKACMLATYSMTWHSTYPSCSDASRPSTELCQVGKQLAFAPYTRPEGSCTLYGQYPPQAGADEMLAEGCVLKGVLEVEIM